MTYASLAVPPGVVKKGTNYSAKGRWSDSNLWRWRAGAMRPVGGWQPRSAANVNGPGRALLTWRDNSNAVWVAIGCPAALFVQDRGGALYNITPGGFTAGRSDAATGGGYGSGPYGAGAYGQPTPDNTQILDATVWSLDVFGPFLIGVSTEDGNLYEWALGTGTAAAKIANSPPCTAAFVTGEHMIFALGANNDPRQVSWCDQANSTVWTASNTNTAGQTELTTQGRLMCGRRVQGGNLLWTDVDLWLATIVQSQLIYAFTKVGDGCGVISRGAAVVLNSSAAWMGPAGFFTFNGVNVSPLPCDVADAIFSNINAQQVSKVTGYYNSLFDEVWWFYPSAGSLENDSYVCWAVTENHWSVGKLARISATDRGALPTPLMMSPNGLCYEHETGLNWDGALPYARLSSFEVGEGDRVFRARQLIPDDAIVGQVSATFYPSFHPDSPATQAGPYSLSPKTDVRFTGRQVDMVLQATGQYDFRVGNLRLEGALGGLR